MNKENIQKLIDCLEESNTFNMSVGRNKCGTPGCIVGHWLYLKSKKEYRMEEFAKYMGIEISKAEKIFRPENEHKSWRIGKEKSYKKRFVSKYDAIRMLKHLKDTGKVVWNPKKWKQENDISKIANKIIKDVMTSVEQKSFKPV